MMQDAREGRLQASRIVNPDLKRFVTLAMPKKGPLTLACRVVAQLVQQVAKDLEIGGALRMDHNVAKVKPGHRARRGAKRARAQ